MAAFTGPTAGFAVLIAALATLLRVVTMMRRGFRAGFDSRVWLEFPGTQFSPDGGLPLMRELDDAPGLTDPASAASRDSRQPTGQDHRIGGLVGQAVYGRLAGYGAVTSTFGKTRIPQRCLKPTASNMSALSKS